MEAVIGVGVFVLLVALILATPFLIVLAFMLAIGLPMMVIGAILEHPVESVFFAILAAILYMHVT